MDMSFLNHKVLKNMEPEKIQIMKELEQAAKGKQLKDTAPLIMSANQKLKDKNMSFSAEETAILIEFLTDDMSPEEKAKVEMMKKVVMTRKK